jgi:transcriptional regulator with XRE-family HTH domain
MGRAHRLSPERLAGKLLAIRQALALTQEQMIERLGYKRLPLYPASISQYESGKREPPLPILLRYARVAGVSMDVLVDDDLDLPKHLPAAAMQSEWIMKRGRAVKQRLR